ncbi:MAG: glucose-6-phosphate isomerase [Planctomycetota bacterium]|jgi:glucose-6-phosphate isomerase
MERLTLDYTGVTAAAIGSEHGIDDAALAAMGAPLQAALAAVQARRTKDLRWMDLPYTEDVLESVLDYATRVQGRFENVVVLGIGGSALGNRALHTALNSPFHDIFPPAGQPRLFVLDNVDPDLMGEFLDSVDPTTCVFNVISKSGSTAETMSQFLILRAALVERLGEEGHLPHIVITTDAEAGVLRPVVDQYGYESFIVPEGVGGRFSVLSPVGLLPAALLSIDIRELLAGAADMDKRCTTDEVFQNPALVYAGLQHFLHDSQQRNIAVTFSYSQRLRDLADWYAQLLAESIGKRVDREGRVVFAGPTPVRAVGVTDQHSQSQLYMEGPHDKWFTLLQVDQPDHAVNVPEGFSDHAALTYLQGRGLGELFAAERDGTRVALADAQRPSVTLCFPRVTANTVGQYLTLMELSVAVMGELYNVNAFDQPGVEAGKVAAYALMGREGYEERRAEIEKAQGGTRRTV